MGVSGASQTAVIWSLCSMLLGGVAIVLAIVLDHAAKRRHDEVCASVEELGEKVTVLDQKLTSLGIFAEAVDDVNGGKGHLLFLDRMLSNAVHDRANS